MSDRSDMVEWLRGEIVGPARRISEATVATFVNGEFTDSTATRRGPLVWRPDEEADLEEVLYFDRESPHRKYGTGRLYPGAAVLTTTTAASPDIVALQATDTIGVEVEEDETESVVLDCKDHDTTAEAENSDTLDEFEVTSPDVRHPSTIGISFCVQLGSEGSVVIRLPRARRFAWQEETSHPFYLNGRYESCKRRWTDKRGRPQEGQMWRRYPAVPPDGEIVITRSELTHGKVIRRDVAMPQDSPLQLRIEIFPRYRQTEDIWLLTVVLRNSTPVEAAQRAHESVLYQSYFEVAPNEGHIRKYPESQRPFDQLDEEEQSLALLYRESATWGIGHGCACGWEAEPGVTPPFLFADILPAVELPSMTPDILDAQGNPLQLSMRELAALPDDGHGPAWQSIDGLAAEYDSWIQRGRLQIADDKFSKVATRHLDACSMCLNRINTGISLLRQDQRVRQAFRLANLAMLLQQIATKQIERRPFYWDRNSRLVRPQGTHQSPWDIFDSGIESKQLGNWRAFQIAFLLMSIDGVRDGSSPDREIVDLIWFPTGGGKTEAYLAVTAFYMFHERLIMADGEEGARRDGTNVLMRYTLRMLTTQQFQRAASLICAMEFLRRHCARHGIVTAIPGQRFSLGLWIGGDGSPNKIDAARTDLNAYCNGRIDGNPLILTECPWCRAQIGRFDGPKPNDLNQKQWNAARTRGISDMSNEGPLLHCTDGYSEGFGQ